MEPQKPTLTKLADFQAVLTDYHTSDHAKKVLNQASFVALSGIAGGGRNTLINYLVDNGPYYFIVSDTTRPPKFRDGKQELDGIHYFFRTEEDFLADLAAGEFVEAEIIHNQQVSGTSIREVQNARTQNLIPIHDYELGGAELVHNIAPNAFVIGLLPPSFEDWQYRLTSRESMQGHEFKNRMHTAVLVLESMVTRPYIKFVISGDLYESSLHLREIVEQGIYTDTQHQKGIDTAKIILEKTKKVLKTL